MQRVNEFVFYELAVKVHHLTELSDPCKLSEIWFQWWEAREAINEIYRQRPLNFTTATALKLYTAIGAVVPEKWDDLIAKFPQQGTEETPIATWVVSQVREAAKEFETVLRNECQVMDTYFVSKKGAYSTIDLVEHAHHQIPEPTRSRLPQQTIADFDQAGKCIAFDIPTAAAFHLLRGTESILKEYYVLQVPGPKQAAPRMRSWGVYIRLIRSHDGDANVLALMDHMKDVYRNPVLHPDENYTDERVQVLFGLCISAVVLIQNEIDKQNSKGAALQFPVTGATAIGP